MEKDTRNPVLGMDLDTEPRLLPATHYTYGKNGRSGTSDKDRVGCVEGIRGNQGINISPFVSEIVIGETKDIKNNAIIKFSVVPNLGISYIQRYFVDTGTAEYITNPDPAKMGGVLNLSLAHRIINARVIEAGFTQLLAWTDGFNPPRLIDIDKMKNGGIYYATAADEQYINLAKRPPNLPPTAAAATDATTKANFLINQYFQFAYRWVYDDNQISTDSPISDIYYTDADNNFTNVSINTGHHTVVKFQLLVRQNNGVSAIGNTNPEWYIFKTVKKGGSGDNATITVAFYGNEALTPVARLDTDKLFESVPDLADQIESVATNAFGNQLMLAAFTQDQDNVAIDIAWANSYKSSGIIFYAGISAGIKFLTTRTVIPVAGDIMYIKVEHTANPDIFFNYVLGSGDVTSALNMANKLASELTAHGIPGVIVTSGGGGQIVQSSNIAYTISIAISVPGILGYSQKTPDYFFKRGMKYGTQGKIGIVYYNDLMKQTGVQYIADYIIPIFNQRGVGFGTLDGGTDVGFLPQIQLTINNLPPTFATKFRIVFFEGTKYFWQIGLDSSFVTGGYKLAAIPLGYTFSVGDRLRVVYEDPVFPNPLTYYDFLIKSFDISTLNLILETDPSNVPAVANLIFYEIYNINKAGDNNFYFEYPVTFDIVGGFHHGNIQNQTNSQPAILTASNDFVYYRLDYTSGIPSAFIESQSLSLSVYSPYNNKGRPQIETPTQRRQKYINFGRWSGKLLTNTQVNDLNVWDSGNYFEVDASKGLITGLRQIGYTLTILQVSNINKTFLGRRQVSNADGSTQLVVTDSLITTIDPSEQDFGTKYPGSVCVNSDNLYFWDTLKGKLVCSGSNGIRPDLGMFMGADGKPKTMMSRYFRDKSAVINSSANNEIISGVDQKYGDIYFTVRNATDNTQETIYFNEGQQMWKYFLDMESGTGETKKIIDCYSNVGQSFFTFMQGNLWQQNALLASGQPKYLNLFGEDKELIVETIGMIEPDKVKIFITSAIHANLAPTKVEFFIPVSAMYPNGMYSYLVTGNYKFKQGVLYADIKGDWFTKGIPVDETAGRWQIAGGRPMYGHVIKVRIHFASTAYTALFSTTTGMIASEKS